MSFKHVLLDGRGDQTWTTPLDVFATFDARFEFELDACASDSNALCDSFFTEEDNSLEQDWDGRRVWINPPFAKAKKFVEKAVEEVRKGALVTMLIPANMNSCYWHDHILGQPNVEIFFPRRGLKFGGSKVYCPCPVAIVVFHPKEEDFMLKTA
jgi:phage N-6-adenine-methyltransferase